ncbi:MAG TPA: selenium cofactor biosynthesis protein YqeC [Clostridiaceae bacterium]
MSKCVVSIVGAGGKTTLMFSLARLLGSKNKVLVTTTTKIYVPNPCQYDFIAIGSSNFDTYNRMPANGIYIYGNGVSDENKILGLSAEDVDSLALFFDYVLVESDGAKGKLIKGWGSNEPVICSSTTHTVGVLNLKALGLTVDEENVHRVDEFVKITGAKRHERVSEEHLTSLVFHRDGLFKHSRGEKVLYLAGPGR